MSALKQRLELSLEPKIAEAMLDFEKELVKEDLENLLPIGEGEISFQSSYIYSNEDSIEVALYILNGTNQKISFEQLKFVILNGQDEVIAHEIFDLTQVGVVPEYSVRPHKLFFKVESLLVDELPKKGCRIAVDNNFNALQAAKITPEKFPENLSHIKRREYEEFFAEISLVPNGEVSVNVYEALEHENDIYITLYIVNGTNRAITMESLPVTLYDAKEKRIAGGIFEIKNVEVNPYKVKLYNLIFNRDEYNANEFDLSKIIVSLNNDKI